MRRVIYTAWVVALLFALVACGSTMAEDRPSTDGTTTQAGEAQSSSSTEAAASGEPQLGGTLVEPLIGEPVTLNPAITTATPDLFSACKIFQGLVRLDKQFLPQPNLASSWEVNEDSTEFVFHLEEDVRWHDGEPFTSADVAWSLMEVSANFGPRVSTAFENISSIDTPDDHTVVIKLSDPYGPFLNLLSCADSAILPKHVYGDGTDILNHPRNTDNPIGTGPFRFVEWKTGSHIIVERNEDYWREGLPYLDQVVLQFMPEGAALANALEAGEVDFADQLGLDYNAFLRLKDLPDFEFTLQAKTPSDFLLFFNTEREPFDDPEVRKALVRAIDRETINERAFFGIGTPGKSAINSNLPYHNPDVNYMEMYPFDSEAAAEALDAAGLVADESGNRTSMTLSIQAGRQGSEPSADIIRANFAEVGIDLTIEVLEQTTMTEKIFVEHDFDLFLTGYNTVGEVALGVQRVYLCSAIGTQPFQNTSSYCNPEVDELFAEGARYADPDLRKVPYFKAQEIIAEDMPVLHVNENATIGLWRKGVHNVFQGGTLYDHWDEVWMEAR